MICGIDEAGRGPLAGPLVVAGVVLKKRVYKLDDSKRLSSIQRQKLFKRIVDAASYRIVVIDNDSIDRDGLSLSITKALKDITAALQAERYIFDGNSTFGVNTIQLIVKADEKIKEVMAASILAKVVRDEIMCDLDRIYPQYGFCRHKGYGTKEHIEAIKKYGLCPVHRKSFRPKALQPTLFD